MTTNDLLRSPNGQTYLWVGPSFDGETLGLTSQTFAGELWGPGVAQEATVTLAMQTDGNLVAYSEGRPIWDIGTWGNPGAALAVQDDMNVVVYSATGKPLWNTATACSNAYNYAFGEPMAAPLKPGWYRARTASTGSSCRPTATSSCTGPAGGPCGLPGPTAAPPKTMTLGIDGNLRVHNATTTT